MFFTAHGGLDFITLILHCTVHCTVLQCGSAAHQSALWGGPGRDSNPGREVYRHGHKPLDHQTSCKVQSVVNYSRIIKRGERAVNILYSNTLEGGVRVVGLMGVLRSEWFSEVSG